ncbi:MBL fold metallo-hydrolase [Stackebrandtia nassauensis]|nr:MBL fold metallo-hydrolase [Stackebrandtia nassauensis]
MTLRQLSGRAWWYPADPDPAKVRGGVGVIADPDGSTVVDAGQSPAHARQVQAAIAEAGLPAARRLVYTHHHWDHTWGACAWDDVEIIGHDSGAALLANEARRPWSHEYLAEQMKADPLLEPSFSARAAAMDGWDDFTIVPPHTTFSDSLWVPGGIEVRHVGGQHTVDSTIVIDRESSVAFLGDCFYPPPYHLRQPGDTHDVGMIRALLAENLEWYVDSHSEPRRRSSIAA